MGKSKPVSKEEKSVDLVKSTEVKPQHTVSKRKSLDSGVLYINSTYNNTLLSLTDKKGNVVLSTSSGAIGFSGAKKGTPFAAAKAGEALAEKAHSLGLREVEIVVIGVGAGRESAIRSFLSKGFSLTKIKDATPIPHNGPRPPKPRRV
jgi:small subunit ribosomal protein S11